MEMDQIKYILELVKNSMSGSKVKLACIVTAFLARAVKVMLKPGKGQDHSEPGSEVIKCFSCSAHLRLKFILLINVKMPTIVGILTFISRINNMLLVI